VRQPKAKESVGRVPVDIGVIFCRAKKTNECAERSDSISPVPVRRVIVMGVIGSSEGCFAHEGSSVHRQAGRDVSA